MIEQVNYGNCVPMFIRGGGAFWIETEDEVEAVFVNDEYSDEIEENLTDDDKTFAEANFRSWLRDDFTDDMRIVQYKHRNGWNQENFDKFICIW